MLVIAPGDALAGQGRVRVGLSQPQAQVVVSFREAWAEPLRAITSQGQRTWTIVGGVLGAVVGYTVVRDLAEVPSGTLRAAALASGVAAIGALMGYVLGS